MKQNTSGLIPNEPRMVEWQGEQRKLIDLCEEHGRNTRTVSARLDRLGWTLEKALTTPPM